MTAFVDVRFRGLRVAQKAKLIEGETDAFVEHDTPLPVGAPVAVLEEGKPERRARVVRVVEHEAGAGTPGMRIVWEAAGVAAVAPVSPPEPEAEPEPEPVSAAADVSSDDTSGTGDRSSDGVVEAPVANGNGSGKKSKKSKKRR